MNRRPPIPLAKASVRFRLFLLLSALVASLGAMSARASDIGITPVAVQLNQANDRATMSVVNSGTDPVIMQVEAIEWKPGGANVEQDVPTSDMVINPSVFTVQAGQVQLLRVGLRKSAQVDREGTYRIVLREVPAPPKPGEVRIAGQVRVLMAVRVPIYVAPNKIVQSPRWAATQAPDGSIVASLANEGNVHVRVGGIRLRSSDGQGAPTETAAPAVILAGDSRSFRLRGASADKRPMTIDVETDQGIQTLPVALASR